MVKRASPYASNKYQPLTARGRKKIGEEKVARCTARSSRGSQCVKGKGHGSYHRTQSGSQWY